MKICAPAFLGPGCGPKHLGCVAKLEEKGGWGSCLSSRWSTNTLSFRHRERIIINEPRCIFSSSHARLSDGIERAYICMVFGVNGRMPFTLGKRHTCHIDVNTHCCVFRHCWRQTSRSPPCVFSDSWLFGHSDVSVVCNISLYPSLSLFLSRCFISSDILTRVVSTLIIAFSGSFTTVNQVFPVSDCKEKVTHKSTEPSLVGLVEHHTISDTAISAYVPISGGWGKRWEMSSSASVGQSVQVQPVVSSLVSSSSPAASPSRQINKLSSPQFVLGSHVMQCESIA